MPNDLILPPGAIPGNVPAPADVTGVGAGNLNTGTQGTQGLVDPTTGRAVNDPGDRPTGVQFKPSVSLPGTNFQVGQSYTVTGRTLGEYISAGYQVAVWFSAIVGIFLIIVSGYRWLFAGGNPTKIARAKTGITKALSGLIVIIFAYILLNTIDTRLVQFNGLDIAQVQVQLIDAGRSRPDAAGAGSSQPPLTQNRVIWDKELKNAAASSGMECTLLKAIMLAESNANQNAVSKDSYGHIIACGLMQVRPENVENVPGVSSGVCGRLLTDPQFNLNMGAQLVSKYTNLDVVCPSQSQCGGNRPSSCYAPSNANSSLGLAQKYRYTLAAYNGGQRGNCGSSVCTDKSTRWECPYDAPGVANTGYQETRNYIPTVTGYYFTLTQNGWGC